MSFVFAGRFQSIFRHFGGEFERRGVRRKVFELLEKFWEDVAGWMGCEKLLLEVETMFDS
jgi:hypothetical protein